MRGRADRSAMRRSRAAISAAWATLRTERADAPRFTATSHRGGRLEELLPPSVSLVAVPAAVQTCALLEPLPSSGRLYTATAKGDTDGAVRGLLANEADDSLLCEFR